MAANAALERVKSNVGFLTVNGSTPSINGVPISERIVSVVDTDIVISPSKSILKTHYWKTFRNGETVNDATIVRPL